MMLKSSSKSKVRKYVPRSEKDVEEHANQLGGQFDSIFKQGADTWTPKQGDNTIRFLEPTWDDHRHYGYEIYVHNRVGADNSTYLCLNKMKKKPCPICEAQMEAKRAGEDDDAKALNPTKRFVCWILDRSERDPNPQLYSMSWTIDRDIAALCKNKRTGKILFVDHPYEGYDVSFSRKGMDIKTKYFGFQIDHESTPLLDDDTKLEEIREFITENPVPDQLKFYSYEHLQQVVKGTTEEKDEELDENEDDEKPARRRSRDAEDDEEDERPSKPARSKSRSDDDDEAEEDERPKRTRSRRDEDDEPEDDKPIKRSHRDEEDEPEEDEPRPKRSRSRSDDDEKDAPPKRSRRDEDETDEEEEEERSPKKKPARAKSRSDDDEEPPFDDDNNEEEEARASKTRKRR
jgi:hypothetical protein